MVTAEILEPRKIKSDTVSSVSPSISHEVVGPDAMMKGSIQYIGESMMQETGELQEALLNREEADC